MPSFLLYFPSPDMRWLAFALERQLHIALSVNRLHVGIVIVRNRKLATLIGKRAQRLIARTRPALLQSVHAAYDGNVFASGVFETSANLLRFACGAKTSDAQCNRTKRITRGFFSKVLPAFQGEAQVVNASHRHASSREAKGKPGRTRRIST